MSVIWWLIVAAVTVVPFWKLLPRFGLASAWALLAVIPAGAIILLYIMAFKDGDDRPGSA